MMNSDQCIHQLLPPTKVLPVPRLVLLLSLNVIIICTSRLLSLETYSMTYIENVYNFYILVLTVYVLMAFVCWLIKSLPVFTYKLANVKAGIHEKKQFLDL